MFQVALCWNRCNYTRAPKNELFSVLLVLKLRHAECQAATYSCLFSSCMCPWSSHIRMRNCLLWVIQMPPSMNCEKWGTSSCIWDTGCGSFRSVALPEAEGDVATEERMSLWLGREEARIISQVVWRAAVVPPCRNGCKCISQVWYVQQCGVVGVLGTYCRDTIKRGRKIVSSIKCLSSSRGLMHL